MSAPSDIKPESTVGLLFADGEGRISRNLLVPAEHPDAWVIIQGPWHGLVFNPSFGQRGTTAPLVPAAPPWTPGGAR